MNLATSVFKAHTLTVTHTLTCPNAHRLTLTLILSLWAKTAAVQGEQVWGLDTSAAELTAA